MGFNGLHSLGLSNLHPKMTYRLPCVRVRDYLPCFQAHELLKPKGTILRAHYCRRAHRIISHSSMLSWLRYEKVF